MGSVLKFLLFKPSGQITLGILIMALGGLMIIAGHEGVPDRAALTEVSGVLESATKITTKRKGSTSVRYELTIRATRGEALKLTLPEREISEETVRTLLGRRVVALYSVVYGDEKDVWELASGNTKIIDYDVTRQKRVETQETAAAVGPYMGGGGLLVSLPGIFMLFRQRRANATA